MVEKENEEREEYGKAKEERRGVDIFSLLRSYQTKQTLEATSMAACLPTCWPEMFAW